MTGPGPGVDAVLGPQGALSVVLERHEQRPEQLQMARAVERAFRDRTYLLAEAGTGTGKTLAYLVPAILSGRKVVVSTATKTLQEQVFFKDVPLLQDKVGLEFAAAYLKGRSNYLCLLKFEEFDRAPLFSSPDEGRYWPVLRGWALRTDSGDRAELELPESFAVWNSVSTGADGCLGQRCPHFEACFVTRARRAAEEADLVVVNHHLFFADLALRTREGGKGDGRGILPRYEAVIFDEAHALEDIATEYFGTQLSNFRVDDLATDAAKALVDTDERHSTLCALSRELKSRSEAFFRAALLQLGLSSGRGQEGVPLTPSSLVPVAAVAAQLSDGLTALGAYCGDEEDSALAGLHRRASDQAQALDLLFCADSPEHVFWAEARGRGLFLRAAPIEVAADLQRRLYGAVDTAVFTSATLTADERFDYFAQRLGLTGYTRGEVATVRVCSPFDFGRQSALYLPSHLPEPNAPGFVEAAAEEILALCQVTGGRAFALFTSLRNMEAAHALVKDRLFCQVLLQGERPKSALLQAFRSEPSVLFASQSFWEGVDVPGEALSMVIIDRLPFASPKDPVVAARIQRLEQKGEDPFSCYQLPEAAISLRQGFGRLIRTAEDRGVVAILDRRLSTRAYGRTLLRSLPAACKVASLEELRRWYG